EPAVQSLAHLLIDEHGPVADFDDARAHQNEVARSQFAVKTDVMFERGIAAICRALMGGADSERRLQMAGGVRRLGDVVLDVHVAHLVAFLHRDIAAIGVDEPARAHAGLSATRRWRSRLARLSPARATILRR